MYRNKYGYGHTSRYVLHTERVVRTSISIILFPLRRDSLHKNIAVVIFG